MTDIGFPPIGVPVAIFGGDSSQRNIVFLVEDNEYSKGLQYRLSSILGIEKSTFSSL